MPPLPLPWAQVLRAQVQATCCDRQVGKWRRWQRAVAEGRQRSPQRNPRRPRFAALDGLASPGSLGEEDEERPGGGLSHSLFRHCHDIEGLLGGAQQLLTGRPLPRGEPAGPLELTLRELRPWIPPVPRIQRRGRTLRRAARQASRCAEGAPPLPPPCHRRMPSQPCRQLPRPLLTAEDMFSEAQRAVLQRLQATSPRALTASGGVVRVTLPREVAGAMPPLRAAVHLLGQALREAWPEERRQMLNQTRQLLGTGVDVNAAGPLGQSPLWSAAYNGDCEVMRLLLAHGADVEQADETGITPLMVRARGLAWPGQTCVLKLAAGQWQWMIATTDE